jgi:hypothetical protein
VPRSTKSVLQFLGFTERHQDRSVALGPCEPPSSAKMQSIEEWDSPRSEKLQERSAVLLVRLVFHRRSGHGDVKEDFLVFCGLSSEGAAGCFAFSGENHAGYLLCGALKRGSRCFICLFSWSAQERLTILYLLCGVLRRDSRCLDCCLDSVGFRSQLRGASVVFQDVR